MPSLGLVVEPVVFNTTVFDLEKDNENDVGNITGGKKEKYCTDLMLQLA